MTELPLRTATPADRARTVDTVVAAFQADPTFHYFFVDSFDEQAATFAGWLFDKRVGRGTVWVVDDGAAVAMWDGPTGVGESGPLDLPADTLARLDAYDAVVHDLLPTSPYWYLGIIATHPSYAGRRYGRALLTAGVREARRAGLPAYLETTNPHNVDLYSRAGWTTTDKTEVAGLPVWVLRHDSAVPHP